MPVELGSFDAIIGMDWLAKYQAVIECAEKIVRIPWRNKTIIIHSDESNQGNVTRLNIISCTKTQKYMEKGIPIFLAHVTSKEVKDKSEKKRLEDVPIVQDLPRSSFLEGLCLVSSTRQVEFQIDMVPCWWLHLDASKKVGHCVDAKRKEINRHGWPGNALRMPPKRTSTSEAPAMTQAAIRKLVADSVSAALEAQAANMANTDNTTRPREAPVARQCSYKEFMSCQPINFKGSEGAVGLIRWFERIESVFSRSNCTEDYKVKFAIGTLIE
ncbi:putative reverse transcriptase domain-containing protein [Tanacetum coccineum]